MTVKDSKPVRKHTKIARTISHIISPPVVFAAMGIAVGVKEMGWWPGLGWAVMHGVLISLLPIAYVVYLLQTGQISDITMTRSERRIPYLVGTLFSILVIVILLIFPVSKGLLCLSMVEAISLAAMGLINNYWKISNHSTAVAAAALISGSFFGVWVGWSLVAVLAFVVFLRLYLRRHTPMQLVAGILLALIVVAGLGCL